MPWAFAMIVAGSASAFFAVRALYQSRSESGITMLRVWLGIGIVLWLVSMLMAFTFMVFADEVSALRDCMDRAVTRQARARCEAEYQEGIADTVDVLLERFGVSAP